VGEAANLERSLPENVRGNTVAAKDVRGVQDVLDDLVHASIHHGDQEEARG
jgi:hypothetical protein